MQPILPSAGTVRQGPTGRGAGRKIPMQPRMCTGEVRMWASNDPNSRFTAMNFATTEVDHVAITKAARRMQAEEFARLLGAVGRGLKAAVSAFATPYKVWREYQDTYAELSQLD